MTLAVWWWALLQVAALALGLAARLGRGGPPALTAAFLRGGMLFTLAVPLFSLLGPAHSFRVGPPAEHLAAGAGALGAASGVVAPESSPLSWIPLVLILAAGLGLARAARALWGLRRVLAGAILLRRVGRVRVLAAPNAPVPLSAAAPGRRWVILDAASLADPELGRVAALHELCHHRRGDPVWAWFELLYAMLAPLAVPLWRPVLDEAVELACDARVSRRMPARDYARVLVRAAETLASPPGLARAAWANLLHRRVAMLLKPSFSPLRSLSALALGLPLLVGVGLAADGRALLRGPELEAALRDASGGGFVVPEAPTVRRALEHFVSDPKGRDFMRRGLDNRAVYGTLVDQALADAGLPAQLAAIPLVESSYVSFDSAKGEKPSSMAPGMTGAGLWMFIPSTARSYGLRVDEQADERLDVVLETDAAVRLLSDLHARYQDWPLAIAAYNMGEKAVDRAIAEGGTRDAWALAEAGQLNDYLPLVAAAAVVMERPEWVR